MIHNHVYKKYKERAIALRKEGKTYSEILAKIPVAKSTISLWLHEVHLAKKQKQRITEKRLAAVWRGGIAKHNQRLERVENITQKAIVEVGELSKRELWLIGTSLYWAEGSKEKTDRPGSGVIFTNSDYRMIHIFIRWLSECCFVPKSELVYEIYIHEHCRGNIRKVIDFWSSVVDVQNDYVWKVRYKKNKINTLRKNVGDLYNGCLRVKVRASSTLNRQIVGWIDGIMKGL